MSEQGVSTRYRFFCLWCAHIPPSLFCVLRLSLSLRLPSGELLECELIDHSVNYALTSALDNFIDPREVELRELREMERRMAREAKEAEAKLAKGQKLYEEFIVAMESTYDGDEEGLAWFRKHCKAIDELSAMSLKRELEVENVKYEQQEDELRRQIHQSDERIRELQNKGTGNNQEDQGAQE
ncbi:hypothetical protein RHS03_01423, partial [Rhizoctonia solani]